MSVLLVLTAGVSAGVEQSRVLQFSHQRVYFPIGEGENVFPNSSFVLMNGEDTLATGAIEYSGPNISYSFPIENPVDTSSLRSWTALIETADVDNLSPLVLGTTGYFPDGDTVLTTDAGARVSVLLYSSPLAMQLDLEAGKLDGCFSYSKYSSVRRGYQVLSSPAPFYCAIVPGIGEHAQRNGLLTTALYYRFNEAKYPVVFDGDEIVPVNRLCVTADDLPRHYSFDPDRGRSLSRELARSTRSVSIGVMDHNLEKAALYFSDILSRDKIRTSLVNSEEDADFRLAFVPIHANDRGASLKYIYDLLAADTSSGESVNQAVRIIGKYLELAQTAGDSAQVDRFLALTEQSLAEDMGVLPLFRPTVFFISQRQVRGYSFDSSGEFDVRHLVKIILPSKPEGAVR